MMFLSYAESQRRRICPYCLDQKTGTRAEEHPVSLLVAYRCEDGHTFYIDEKSYSQSEVAEINQKIQAEFEAMQPRFAKVADHASIRRRYGNVDRLHVQLVALVGDEAASDMLIECNENAMREGRAG